MGGANTRTSSLEEAVLTLKSLPGKAGKGYNATDVDPFTLTLRRAANRVTWFYSRGCSGRRLRLPVE